MFFLLNVIYLLILFSVQTTLLDSLSFGGVRPDLALVFVVYCAIHLPGNRGVAMGFAVGLIQDCLSGGLLGTNTLSKSLIAFFFSTLKDKIVVEGIIPISFFLVASSFVDGAIFYFVLVALLKGEVAGSFLFPSLFVFALYNGLAGLVVFWILNTSRRWLLSKFPNRFPGLS